MGAFKEPERSCMIDQFKCDFRFGCLIHDVSRLRRIVFDRAFAPLKITRSQWRLLELVAQNDGFPQSQLANELDIGKVAVGSLIDRLERTGFVVWKIDPSDRRVNRVFLTEQAQELLGNIRKEIEEFDARITWPGAAPASSTLLAETSAWLRWRPLSVCP
jgi:DNA-binding MarR family transcriptional regulator